MDKRITIQDHEKLLILVDNMLNNLKELKAQVREERLILYSVGCVVRMSESGYRMIVKYKEKYVLCSLFGNMHPLFYNSILELINSNECYIVARNLAEFYERT